MNKQVKDGDKLYHKKWGFIDYGIVFGLKEDGSFLISHLTCNIPQCDDTLFSCNVNEIGKTLFWSEEDIK